MSDDSSIIYPNSDDLNKKSVFSENGKDHFVVSNLPEILSYGKHYFSISWIGDYLQDSSPINFEFRDSEDNLIFSDITDYSVLNGAVFCYVWLKKDPLRINNEIADGDGTLTIVGELENVPNKWKGIPNVRYTIPIQIKKSVTNNSPILFQNITDIQSSSLFSEVKKFDNSSITYNRSYIVVSASHLKTFGGKVDKIELSYKEDRSLSNEYKVISVYPLSSSLPKFEVTDGNGLNSLSDLQSIVTPREIRRNGDVSFKLRFLNSDGEFAQDIVNNKDVEITGSITNFTGSTFNIETDDNLIKTPGSFVFGSNLNDGFRVDFKGKTEGDYQGETTLEFTPIVGGVDQKGYVIAEKGGFVNDPGSNEVTQSENSSLVGSTFSIISSSNQSIILGASGSSILYSPHSGIYGGIFNKIHHSSSNQLVVASNIYGGSSNLISGSIPGSTSVTDNSVIIGGSGNIIHQTSSDGLTTGVVVGGVLNVINKGLQPSIVGGYLNKVNGNYSAIIGGSSNRVDNHRSIILAMAGKTSSADDTVYIQNLSVDGSINASSLDVTHFTSSFITASTIQTSGSNIFGDAITDTHTFNGHITASGNITASSIDLGGNLIVKKGLMIQSSSNAGTQQIQFSNDLSEGDKVPVIFRTSKQYGGLLKLNVLKGLGYGIHHFVLSGSGGHTTSDIHVGIGGLPTPKMLSVFGSTTFGNDPDGSDEDTHIFSGSLIQTGSSFQTFGHITASGNISSSGDVYAQDYYVENKMFASYASITDQIDFGNPTQNIGYNGATHKFTNNITASGNISASGFLSTKHLILSGGSGVFTSASLAGGGGGVSSYDDLTAVPSGIYSSSLQILGNITSSGNISASGNIYASKYYLHPTKATYIGSLDGGDDITFEAADDIRIRPTDDLSIHQGSTEYVRFDGVNKRVGIGTGSPQSRLHLSGSTGATSGIRQSRAGAKIWTQEIDSSGRLQWGFRSTEGGSKTTTVTFDDSTNYVGIGTAAPNEQLEVSGSLLVSGPKGHITASGNISASGNLEGFNVTAYGLEILASNAPAIVIKNSDDTIGWNLATKGTVHSYFNPSSPSNTHFGIKTITPTVALQVEGDISSSGNIETQASITASGIRTNEMTSTGDITLDAAGDDIFFKDGGTERFRFNLDANPSIVLTPSTNTGTIASSDRLHFESINNMTFEPAAGEVVITPANHLEVLGNISSSAPSTGSFGHLMVGGGNFSSASLAADNGAVSAVANGSNNRIATFSSADALNGEANLLFNGSILEIGGKLKVSSHITASGNISASATSTGSFGSMVVTDKVQGNLTIDGILFATRKSFLIDKPEGGKLEYGSLEGPQNDVFHRGELKGDNVIHLPKEWEWLVDKNTITTQLTSIGKHQELYFKEIKDNKIFIDINGMFKTKENIHCYYIIHGTRKDIELIRNYQ